MLEVNNISKSIKGKQILKDVTFTTKSSNVIGIIGPNGSGKSTFFKIFVGLIRANEGEIRYNGVNILNDRETFNDKIGFLIEEPVFYPDMTGKENLDIISKYYKIKDKENIDEVINLMNIKGFINNKVKTYSMGMKQKLGIVTAVVHDPELVIFDEPQNSLDATAILNFRRVIEYLKEKKRTVIISSHILNEVKNLCDIIIIIRDGDVIETLDLTNMSKEDINIEKLYHERTSSYEDTFTPGAL